MNRREWLYVSAILLILLGILYVPQMRKPGGIHFGIIQDITSVYGFYPWDTFTNRELRAGYFPLWNPHNGLGEPHIANMQSAVFYPLTWLKVMANMRPIALDLIIVLRLFLAGLFMCWFLGDLKLNFWGRAFGAASFATTGYFTRYVYMSHLNVEILLPLILLCFGRLVSERKKRWFLGSAAVVWLAIVGGFPEATFYALLLGIIWYFYCAYKHSGAASSAPADGRTHGFAPTIAGALVLGAVMSAPQLLTFIEYLANAWSYHEPGIGMGHSQIKYAFTLVEPWFFGTNDVSPLVPFLTPYIGFTPAVFAIVGALRGDRKGLFFLVISVVMFGLIYGIPPFIWLGKIYPLSITLNFKYAVPIFAFCISAIAGMGLDDVLEKPSSSKMIIALFLAAILGIFILYGLKYKFFDPYIAFPAAKWMFPVDIAFFLLLILPWAVKKRGHFVPIIILIVLLIYPAFGNRPQYNPAIETGEKSVVRKFLSSHNDARFAAEGDTLFPDTNLVWNLYDFRYYSPVYLRNYINVFARANGLKTPEEIMRNFKDHSLLQPERDKLTDPIWAKLGLGYWVGGPPGSMDLLPDLIAKADWRTETRGMIGRGRFLTGETHQQSLFAHAPSRVSMQADIPLENPQVMAMPAIDAPVWQKSDGVVFEVRVDSEGEAHTIFQKFTRPGPTSEVVLDLSQWAGKKVGLIFITNPGPSGDRTNDWSGWVVPSLLSERSSNWVRVEKNIYVQPAQMGWIDEKMVFSHIYYPGWRANGTDEKEVKIWLADGVFQSVDSRVRITRFIYRPISFAIGLWSFLVSGCFLVAVILLKNKGK